MTSLVRVRESIQNEWARLQRQWQTTTDLWNDPVRHRFEHDFWVEYERIIGPTLNELDRLALVLAQAQREVK